MAICRRLDSAEEARTGLARGPSGLNAFDEPMHARSAGSSNEDKGLRPGVAKRCAHMLRIPLARSFDSLNVAQAGTRFVGTGRRASGKNSDS